jgi:superfamily II DNA or RNA helicase
MSKIIIQNGNMCELDIPLKYAQKLYNEFAIRHPNAFYLRTRQRGMQNWDGKIHYITKTGQFKIGLLPRVYNRCIEMGIKPKVVDMRQPLPKVSKVVTNIGKYKLRPEQEKAVKSVINNKVGNLPFHIGVLDYTVNAGKCTGKGTLIHTEDGLLPIEKIVSETGKIRYKGKVLTKEGVLVKPNAGVYNEIRVVKITTSQGYTLICGYENHRLYTYYGDNLQWVYVKDLKKGDCLPISLEYTHSKNTIGKNLSYTLGALSGDGPIHQVSKNQINISISGQDIEVAEVVKATMDEICKTPVEIKPHKRFKGFHISKSDTNFAKLLQEEYPELIGTAHEKYIPDKILQASYDDLRNYIAGLFDTDGYNSSSHGRRSLSFTTVNLENARRVQQALLSLGIVCCLKSKKTSCNGKESIAYRITIHSEFYDEFLEIIPMRIERKCISSNSQRNNYSKELRNISSNCYWDKIDKIEILDKYPCYDMEIPKYHNYLSNGFISHNTLIMSSLYLSYKKQLKTLLITNDSDWLNQAREEFKQYLPGEDITFVQGKVLNWSNFTIGMVQSISRNMRFYQKELSQIDMVLVDEADQGGSKQYQNVITRLFNTRIRIGLSGTIYMSKLAKDKVKNMNLECFFGEVIAEFKLKDSIKKGYSTNTVVKIVPGKPWYGNWESDCISYKEIYDDSITENKMAWLMAYNRLQWNLNQGRFPALVVCKYIAHCENLYKFFKKKLGDAYNIAYVHVNTKSKLRQQIMKDFREGKIDILVSTTIIARGKNFPKLRYLLNAASMDSQEKSIQFLGRLVRTDKSKKKVYLDDLHYPGDYLDRHGKHRKQYYQRQELKVILLDKLWRNHPNHSLSQN